jgi:uncharacterized membrane protein
MLQRLTNYLILLFLFLLPWQTRWIIESGILNNRPWEFGTVSLYGTEILLWLIVILTGIRLFARLDFWQSKFNADYFKTHRKNILAVLIFLFSLAVFIRFGNPISWHCQFIWHGNFIMADSDFDRHQAFCPAGFLAI